MQKESAVVMETVAENIATESELAAKNATEATTETASRGAVENDEQSDVTEGMEPVDAALENPVPGAKDLPESDAQEKIKQYLADTMNTNTNASDIILHYADNGSTTIWDGFFVSPDNSARFSCQIDSITGQLIGITKFNGAKFPDSEWLEDPAHSEKDYYLSKESELINNPVYAETAKKAIESTFPDKEITEVTSSGTCFTPVLNDEGKAGEYADLEVAVKVKFKDGTSCYVGIGQTSKDVYGFSFE